MLGLEGVCLRLTVYVAADADQGAGEEVASVKLHAGLVGPHGQLAAAGRVKRASSDQKYDEDRSTDFADSRRFKCMGTQICGNLRNRWIHLFFFSSRPSRLRGSPDLIYREAAKDAQRWLRRQLKRWEKQLAAKHAKSAKEEAK